MKKATKNKPQQPSADQSAHEFWEKLLKDAGVKYCLACDLKR